MAVTAPRVKKKKKKKSRRPAFLVGGLALVVLMFAVGFLLSWQRPATENAASMPSASAPQAKQPSLEELLKGLEAKVAADPTNTDQRLLLAQTYTELGQRAKGIEQLRTLHKDAPQNTEVTILLATALMDSESPADLRESSKILDDAVRSNPAVVPMARLYQGDILLKLGDAKGGIKIWKDYLKQMPTDDKRRALFEEKISQASAKK